MMKRPLSDLRPIGPFAQSGNIGGVTLVYTTGESGSFPSNTQIENRLEAEYESARQSGRSEVVAANIDVDRVGSPRADVRGIRVNTGVSIMNIEQFEAVKEITTQVMEDVGSDIRQVAVAVPSP